MATLGITLDGLAVNTVEDTGVTWTSKPLDGWQGPGSTISPQQRPRGNGAWVGDSYLTARTLTLTGSVVAPSQALLEDALDRLNDAASATSNVTLEVAEALRTRRCTVRRQDVVLVKQHTPVWAEFSIQLVAADPRKLGDELTETTGLPSTSGGLTVPFTVPFTIDATTVTGQVSLTNPGNFDGPVRLRIDGPVTGPIVTHVASGRALVFSSSLTLGAGEWLDVDMDARTVLANGQSSRNGWVTGRGWSSFEPGANTWAFTALSFDPGASLTVYATPAWE